MLRKSSSSMATAVLAFLLLLNVVLVILVKANPLAVVTSSRSDDATHKTVAKKYLPLVRLRQQSAQVARKEFSLGETVQRRIRSDVQVSPPSENELVKERSVQEDYHPLRENVLPQVQERKFRRPWKRKKSEEMRKLKNAQQYLKKIKKRTRLTEIAERKNAQAKKKLERRQQKANKEEEKYKYQSGKKRNYRKKFDEEMKQIGGGEDEENEDDGGGNDEDEDEDESNGRSLQRSVNMRQYGSERGFYRMQAPRTLPPIREQGESGQKRRADNGNDNRFRAQGQDKRPKW